MNRHAVLTVWLALAVDASAQGLSPEAIQSLPAFLEKTTPALMAERHVPGVAIAIVHNGQAVDLRGFGVSSLVTSRPVDPATAFRVGSVSKLFTAIAALQLVEAGKLDLNRNIHDYVPELVLRAPTTTHQLLTHTAGFGERLAGAYTESTPLPSLTNHLRRQPPQQVTLPGRAYSYSNYNYAVAGAVIEAVSGQSFEQYMSDRMFVPLGLTSTSAYQPPPGNRENVATGYQWDGGRQVVLPARLTFAAASGGVTTSATDMARLITALLGDDTAGGARLLSPGSTKQLLGAQYTPHPNIPAAAYGAMHWRSRGVNFVFKDGTLGDQVGAVLLDPRERLGMFLAANGLRLQPLVDSILTHLYGPAGQASPRPTPVPGGAERAARYEGVFRDFHHTRNDLSRLFALLPMIQTRVSAGQDGSIRWKGRTWIEIEPRLFQSADGGDHIVFRGSDDDTITELHAWGATYERIGFLEQAPFHLAVVLFCLITFISYLAIGLVHFRRTPSTTQGSRRGRFCSVVLALVNIAFVAGLVVLLRDAGSSVPLPLAVTLWLSLPIVALIVSAPAVLFAAAAWSAGWWRRSERLAYSALAAGSLVFSVFLNYWKLLGFHY